MCKTSILLANFYGNFKFLCLKEYPKNGLTKTQLSTYWLSTLYVNNCYDDKSWFPINSLKEISL